MIIRLIDYEVLILSVVPNNGTVWTVLNQSGLIIY